MDYMESQFNIYSNYKIPYNELSVHSYLLFLKHTLIYSNFSDWATLHDEQSYFLYCTDYTASNYTFLNWSFTYVKRILWKDVLRMEEWLGQWSAITEYALAVGNKGWHETSIYFSIKGVIGGSWLKSWKRKVEEKE